MICLMLVGLNLGVLGVVFGAEKKVTLTTYYPAPYGEYENVKANGELLVGSSSHDLFLAPVPDISNLTYKGYARIYGMRPQLDFVDVDNIDWAIHVNANRMYFIPSPWNYQCLVLNGANGYVGIGTNLPTTSPSEQLTVAGNILVSANATTGANGDITANGNMTATAFLYSSDVFLKKDIQPLLDPLGMIGKINGVEFNWKEDNKPDIGLIAQDVEKVLPGLVHTGQDGYKSIDYVRMIPVLVEAVKAQQAQIDSLKAQLKEIGKT